MQCQTGKVDNKQYNNVCAIMNSALNAPQKERVVFYIAKNFINQHLVLIDM